MKVIGLIPCRYDSTRFPGKPLADIHGKPMMWHVYQQCLKSTLLHQIFIVTDSTTIAEEAIKLKMNVFLTKGDHETGTDRIAEAAQSLDGDYYVNIQGDEPMIDPNIIDRVANEIISCKYSSIVASNAFIEITEGIDDPNVVKTIFTNDNMALAYSRYPIPYPKKYCKYYKQLGIYAFSKEGLNLFASLKPSPIEMAEQVEMYRILENDYNIKMVEAYQESFSVDTPEDLIKVKKLMENKQ